MRFIRSCAMAIAALLIAAASFTPASAGVSFDLFYSNLSPHGSWLVSAQYGRVWRPGGIAAGWSPYVDGHWVYADVGWTWVSDYEWGSIPYHYGTWVSDPAIGWAWVPGYTWAPSWVVFRTGPDFVGWAPVAPGFSIGVSVGAPAADAFVFVSSHDFLAPRLSTCIVPSAQRNVIINRTTVVNNFGVQNNVVVNRGPDVGWAERAAGHRIERVPIERVPRAAPGGWASRAQISVDPGRTRQGLRAAEPVSARQPLPGASSRRAGNGAALTRPVSPGAQESGRRHPSQTGARPAHGGAHAIAARTAPAHLKPPAASAGRSRTTGVARQPQGSSFRPARREITAPSRPRPDPHARTAAPRRAAPAHVTAAPHTVAHASRSVRASRVRPQPPHAVRPQRKGTSRERARHSHPQ